MEDSIYSCELRLSPGQPAKIIKLKAWQLRCMVNETFHQPKPGRRGPKPVSWEVAAHRIERLIGARDALRSKGTPVTKPAILDWLDLPGDKTTVDRWLEAAQLTWQEFLDL